MKKIKIDLYHAIQKESFSPNINYSYQQLYGKSQSWKKLFEITKTEISDLSVVYVCIFFSLEFALKALILKSRPSYNIKDLKHNYSKMLKVIEEDHREFWPYAYILLEKFDLLRGNIDAVQIRYPSIGDMYSFNQEKIDKELRMFFSKLKISILKD